MSDFREKDVTTIAKDCMDDRDVESVRSTDSVQYGLQRQMKNRHISMISIGGTEFRPLCVIGTGLFLGTASALRDGGPVGLLLGYCTIGSLCYCVMIALGEMAAFLPIPGGHITFAERFVDSAWSATLGFMYWYNWLIILPAEISATAVLINYWNTTVNNAAWISVCLVIVWLMNAFGAGACGEAEFIFASIKVITITGLIILGIVLDLGGGPNHDRIGFRYWRHPGPFAQFNSIAGAERRFLAWWAVMSQAAFSFIGTEIVAIAGAECKNPKRNIPKAIRRVYVRILLFYIGGVTVIGLPVPSNDPGSDLTNATAAASPFVLAINNAGIKVLPSIINACLLTSAWSAANSDLVNRVAYQTAYTKRANCSTDRLAVNGNAPKIFAKVSKRGLPWVSLIFCGAFGLLSYMDVRDGSGRVFGWFSNMTAIAGLISWLGIAVTYIRFHEGLRVQGYDRKTLPFRAPFQPYASCKLVDDNVPELSGWTVFLKDSWNTASFITQYLPLILFPVLYVIIRLWRRTHWRDPRDMDFKSGLQEALDASYDEPAPRNIIERVWSWLM
ncbi:hypothetical protein CERSUDRAFT_125991 [Gelatoporia subvermispora B]|uniref:Amino acid permease/ SLC12A domain-containing protein n=1 Tax=Ceriporiopsis subvermispora (strain B) TaxID=914234 RepID=M2PD91_CERS8|nr:hypothetical protein CERSUDRAFT_125991 [Gelatoporia subvermispora B]